MSTSSQVKKKKNRQSKLVRSRKERDKDRQQKVGCQPKYTFECKRAGNQFSIPTLEHIPRSWGLVLRTSDRWINARQTKSEMSLPLIDKKGKFTGSTLVRTRCTALSFIATVVATIANRLSQHISRSNNQGHRTVVRYKRLIVQSAYYYAISKNNWFLDRFLFLSRNLEKNRRAAQSLLMKFLTRLDDNKRFVYCQVSFQTNWLLFRAHRPRDKSIFFEESSRWRKDLGPATAGKLDPFWVGASVRKVACNILHLSPHH